jgi:hypothetical protein
MKVTITKKRALSGDYFFQVFKDKDIIKSFIFYPDKVDTDLWSEKKVFSEAMKLAKEIESLGEPKAEVVYESKEIDPIAYFMAANMSEEEIQNTIGVDLSKIDEP